MIQKCQQNTGQLAKMSKHGSAVSREKLVRCEFAGKKLTLDVNFSSTLARFRKPMVLTCMSNQKARAGVISDDEPRREGYIHPRQDSLPGAKEQKQ
jgi:hypothetical protein